MDRREATEGARQDNYGGWCPEADTRDNVRALRNVLMGLWTGRMLGFEGTSLSAYAEEVHFSDFEEVGDNDIIRKIVSDLGRAGVTIEEATVRSKLNMLHREALVQTFATD